MLIFIQVVRGAEVIREKGASTGGEYERKRGIKELDDR